MVLGMGGPTVRIFPWSSSPLFHHHHRQIVRNEDGLSYHSACYNCGNCQTSLLSQPAYKMEDMVILLDDARRLHRSRCCARGATRSCWTRKWESRPRLRRGKRSEFENFWPVQTLLEYIWWNGESSYIRILVRRQIIWLSEGCSESFILKICNFVAQDCEINLELRYLISHPH